jgi:uncharacterized protein (TIGR03083 family)
MARNDPPAISGVISSERQRFAAWLGELPADAWAKQSLCSGWSVADVVGHVTFPWRLSTPRLLGQMIRHRGFEGASRANAPDLAQIGPSAMIAEIRDHADDMTRPPGAAIHDLLAEIVVHPLDIALPVDLSWTPDAAATAELLEYLTTSKKGGHYHPAGGVSDLSFVATDIDWAWGSGSELRGPAAGLALVLTGRGLTAGLEGPGVEVLPRRG